MDKLKPITTYNPHGYKDSGREVVYDGFIFPLNLAGLERRMTRMGLNLMEQLDYLHRAQMAFSVGHPPLVAEVSDLIHKRQELAEEIIRLKEGSAGQMDKMLALGLLADGSDPGTPSAVSLEPDLPVPPVPRLSFFLIDQSIRMEDVRDLAHGLYNNKLLSPPEKGLFENPLAIAFGVDNSGKMAPQPMMWIGKINQLHFLIEYLITRGFIGCRKGAKWSVAAQLFYPCGVARRYTAKNLSDARTIKEDDKEQVCRCFSKKWVRVGRCG